MVKVGVIWCFLEAGQRLNEQIVAEQTQVRVGSILLVQSAISIVRGGDVQ